MPKLRKKKESDFRIFSFAFEDHDRDVGEENIDYYFLFDYSSLGYEGLTNTVKEIIDQNDTEMDIYQGFCSFFQTIIDRATYIKLLKQYEFHTHFLINFIN